MQQRKKWQQNRSRFCNKSRYFHHQFSQIKQLRNSRNLPLLLLLKSLLMRRPFCKMLIEQTSTHKTSTWKLKRGLSILLSSNRRQSTPKRTIPLLSSKPYGRDPRHNYRLHKLHNNCKFPCYHDWKELIEKAYLCHSPTKNLIRSFLPCLTWMVQAILKWRIWKGLVERWVGKMVKVTTQEFLFLYNIVRDLIQAIDPNHDGRISFDEFLLILRHIEERLQQNQSSLTTNQSRMSYGFPKLATA